MLCRSQAAVPEGAGWALEPKWDGVRLIVARDGAGRMRAWTRHGTAHAGRFAGLEAELAAVLPDGSALDGELVALCPADDGAPAQDFAAALRALYARRPREEELFLMTFDLLALAGDDLRGAPCAERRTRLEEILGAGRQPGRVRLTPRYAADAARHEHHLRLGFEGSVAKRLDGRYAGGRRDWVKVKARHELQARIVSVHRGSDGQWRALCDAGAARPSWAMAFSPQARAGLRSGELGAGSEVRVISIRAAARAVSCARRGSSRRRARTPSSAAARPWSGRSISVQDDRVRFRGPERKTKKTGGDQGRCKCLC